MEFGGQFVRRKPPAPAQLSLWQASFPSHYRHGDLVKLTLLSTYMPGSAKFDPVPAGPAVPRAAWPPPTGPQGPHPTRRGQGPGGAGPGGRASWAGPAGVAVTRRCQSRRVGRNLSHESRHVPARAGRGPSLSLPRASPSESGPTMWVPAAAGPARVPGPTLVTSLGYRHGDTDCRTVHSPLPDCQGSRVPGRQWVPAAGPRGRPGPGPGPYSSHY